MTEVLNTAAECEVPKEVKPDHNLGEIKSLTFQHAPYFDSEVELGSDVLTQETITVHLNKLDGIIMLTGPEKPVKTIIHASGDFPDKAKSGELEGWLSQTYDPNGDDNVLNMQNNPVQASQ